MPDLRGIKEGEPEMKVKVKLKEIEQRLIDVERALERILHREEMAGLDAQTGGDREWFG